ncbi:MAG: hypothetical protein K2X86_18080, partial [Cytophagaceae bacterium]|nr:hypothetical protein [Cytophagaceae bacterium]
MKNKNIQRYALTTKIFFFIIVLQIFFSGEVKAQTYTWNNVQILAGGFVTGIVYSPAQANLIYARTDDGELCAC